MPPTRNSSTKASGYNRPRKVASQKPKKSPKQRKIPKALAKIKFCHYGAKLDVFNGDATLIANPSPASESVAPLHVTASQDTLCDPLYSASSYYPPVLPSANLFHPQIPVSEGYLDNANQVIMYRGIESSYAPIPPHVPFQNEVQTADNIPSMSNYQYGQYSNSQLISLPSSAGRLSMGYDDEHYWFPDTNTQYSISNSTTSCVPNASMVFRPTLFNDMYVETSTAGSYLAMMSNDGTTFPFPNNDARYNFYYYM